MKYRNYFINACCVVICVVVGYSAINSSEVSEAGKASLTVEWMPGVRDLGPLSPAEFFNFDSGVLPLGGDGGNQRNEVVIGNLEEPENDISSIFDLNYQDERYVVALDLMREGRLHEAEVVLQGYLDELPMHADAWRQLGDCQYNVDKVQEAYLSYQNALKYEPENYLALRGQGVAALYIGYQSYDYNHNEKAHKFFQTSLSSFHACLKLRNEDVLSAYGQSLAAEGVSRELYRIARAAIGTDNHDQAKSIIRNCLDIIDTAINATEDRLDRKPNDEDAMLLLSSLLVRRAKILQPFGHVNEASGNLDEAMKIIEPIAEGATIQSEAAKSQIALCVGLKTMWQAE